MTPHHKPVSGGGVRLMKGCTGANTYRAQFGSIIRANTPPAAAPRNLWTFLGPQSTVNHDAAHVGPGGRRAEATGEIRTVPDPFRL